MKINPTVEEMTAYRREYGTGLLATRNALQKRNARLIVGQLDFEGKIDPRLRDLLSYLLDAR